MTQEKKPFHEAEYKEEDGYFSPILEIIVGKNKKKILAYADTGCDTGISVFKEQVKDIELGLKINDEPTPCILADGHRIGADEYLVTANINGEEREIVVSVIDPSKDLGYVSPEEVIPLVGRDFLDNFDVLFKGKQKKIAIFKC